MNDQELITAVRESVGGVHMDVPAEQIASRSRVIRASGRRRLAACVTAGVAAGSVALGLGLSGALGATPEGGAGVTPGGGTGTITATGTIRGTGTTAGTGTIRTAAFTLTRNAGGTDTLTLTMSQMLDSAVLQQALARDGIRALVKTGSYCWSTPAAPDPASIGVLSVRLPVKPPHIMVPASSRPAFGELMQVADRTTTVINPAAMPPGTELFFGYSASIHALFTDLIYTSSYTCGSGLPPGGTSGS
jgi:hypothetical protein